MREGTVYVPLEVRVKEKQRKGIICKHISFILRACLRLSNISLLVFDRLGVKRETNRMEED